MGRSVYLSKTRDAAKKVQGDSGRILEVTVDGEIATWDDYLKAEIAARKKRDPRMVGGSSQ